MTHAPKRLFIAALLAATGAVAIAQAPAPVQPAAGEAAAQRAAPGERRARMDPAQRQQRMAERHAQRMADLKAQLQISPAQEGAWNAYSAAMQPPTDAQRPRMNRAEVEQLSTPQRIDRMQQFSAERQARMQQRGDAVKAFYAQLTPAQQKTYDERAMRGNRGEGKRGGPGMRHHGGYGPR